MRHVDPPTPIFSYLMLFKFWKKGLCLRNPVISSALGLYLYHLAYKRLQCCQITTEMCLCSLWNRLHRKSAEQTVLRNQIACEPQVLLTYIPLQCCQITTKLCLCSLWDKLDRESAEQTMLRHQITCESQVLPSGPSVRSGLQTIAVLPDNDRDVPL